MQPILLDASGLGQLPPELLATIILFLTGLIGWFIRQQLKGFEEKLKQAAGELLSLNTKLADAERIHSNRFIEQEKLITQLRIENTQQDARLKVIEQDVSNSVSIDVYNERSDSHARQLAEVLKTVRNLDKRKVSYGEFPAAKSAIPREEESDPPPQLPPVVRPRQPSGGGFHR